jgi:hypothetical protein
MDFMGIYNANSGYLKLLLTLKDYNLEEAAALGLHKILGLLVLSYY